MKKSRYIVFVFAIFVALFDFNVNSYGVNPPTTKKVRQVKKTPPKSETYRGSGTERRDEPAATPPTPVPKLTPAQPSPNF